MIVKPDPAPRVRRPGCIVNANGLPKQRYSHAEAKRAIRGMRADGATEPLSSYKCDCGFWHVGRDPRRWSR